MTALRGVTWNHTRGWAPLAVTAQVFSDHHPDFRIEWDRQSLYEFGEGRTDELARTYDLIVIDHPMTAQLAEAGVLRPFDKDDLVPAIGQSARSYVWADRQWALPLDAACQVSVRREDLLSAFGETMPTTWTDVLDLARRTRRVAASLTPIDAFCSWMTVSASFGESATPELAFLDESAATTGLELIRELASVVPEEYLHRNPIATLEAMAGTDDVWYCPLIFGYSNYSRTGYAGTRLSFGAAPRRLDSDKTTGTVLGGAGLAVSAYTKTPEAADYARWVTSDTVQCGDYVRGGGQPAAAAAWYDAEADRLTNGFLSDTRATLGAAILRPRSIDFPQFQTEAAAFVHAALTGTDDARRVVRKISKRYSQLCG